MSATVADIERAIARRFPPERAESWDRVGLLAGDPDATVTGVVLALDATVSAVQAAADRGANVLVTHHPAFLEPPASLTPAGGPGAVLFAAVARGIALVNAHTNLDRDEEAQRLLPDALGLEPIKPLERALMPMSIVTVYVPAAAEQQVSAAMFGAGGGRIGEYEDCSFASPGVGSFTPPADASPAVGKPGESSTSQEVRLEVVCPRRLTRGVVSAAVSAHPYEEPLVSATDVVIARNAARLGMLCDTPAHETLGALVASASSAFGASPRVWGDADANLGRVACTTGSGGSLIGEALFAGASALIAGEVRYHDALEAAEAGLAVVELGHDVSEWPLVSLLERTVKTVSGIDVDSVIALPARPGWWTAERHEGDR